MSIADQTPTLEARTLPVDPHAALRTLELRCNQLQQRVDHLEHVLGTMQDDIDRRLRAFILGLGESLMNSVAPESTPPARPAVKEINIRPIEGDELANDNTFVLLRREGVIYMLFAKLYSEGMSLKQLQEHNLRIPELTDTMMAEYLDSTAVEQVRVNIYFTYE